MNDLKFAFRQLLKNPGFTAVAVLTLALGIGANTAIFSVIYGVLLKPLPYRDPEQLIRVFESSASQPKFPMSAGDFQDYRELNSTLASLALYTRQDLELSKDDQPELLAGLRITSGYFDVLGERPMLGREFRREDEAPGNHHVVILSNGVWKRRFNSDPTIIGKTVSLTGEAFAVVGVMPPGVQHVGGDYRSMAYGETVDFWWPVTLRPQDNRGSHYLNAVGRLKPGVQPVQASADLNVIAERLARQFPDTNGAFHIALEALRETMVGRARTTLLVVFGAVFLELLIACVNVANLLLARSSAREREMAVRTAVGAGRWQIVRQLMTESLLLATISSAAGIAMAQTVVVALGRFGPEQLPRLQSVQLDGHVLFFTLALTLLTGLLFGLAPALQAGKPNLNGLLKEGGRAGAGGHQRSLHDFSSEPKEQDWRMVVGVVGDVKDHPDSATAVPAFYFSLAQSPTRQVTLAVRTTAEPSGMIAAVRDELQHLDKNVPLADVKTLETITAGAVAGRRFTFWLVGCFAATALTLAAIGIYGVLSYLVAQRTREIGVRMALGAQTRDVVRLTLKQGMRPTLVGVALGLAGAFTLTRLMSSLLFGVSATDPETFVVSALFLLLIALLPCWLPARRAARVDPMEALRYE